MLDERKAAILGALVEDYIATGSPVSSRAVLERSNLGCSTATIRNEFVLLENEGLIAKPHASAGRVPTDRDIGTTWIIYRQDRYLIRR